MLILILCLSFSVGYSKIKTFTTNSTNEQEQISQEETESTPIKIPSAKDPNTKKVVPKNTPETDYIDLIRSSSFYDYHYITIGEGFDNYFGETDWYEFYEMMETI